MAQLKVLLEALKRPDDGPMPTQKKDIIVKLEQWGRRGGITKEEEVAMVETVFATENVARLDETQGDDIEKGYYEKVQARIYVRWKCTDL